MYSVMKKHRIVGMQIGRNVTCPDPEDKHRFFRAWSLPFGFYACVFGVGAQGRQEREALRKRGRAGNKYTWRGHYGKRQGRGKDERETRTVRTKMPQKILLP